MSYVDSGYDNLLNYQLSEVSKGEIALLGSGGGGTLGSVSSNMLGNPTTDSTRSENVLGGTLVDALILGVNSYLRGGATDYDSGDGFFLGYRVDEEDYGFFIGKSTGNKLTYNTTDDVLAVTGTITASAGAIGGWNITADTLYSLSTGTPSASPNN